MRGVRKCMKPVIKKAEELGFSVSRTRSGHLKFTQPGCTPVFASTTPGDRHAAPNTVALLRRSYRGEL